MADAPANDTGKPVPTAAPDPKPTTAPATGSTLNPATETHTGTAIPKAPEKSVNETSKPAIAAAEAHPGPVVAPKPEHLATTEGDSPERKKAVEDAKKASDHPVTQPGTPAPDGGKRRPHQTVALELAEARAKLDDMIGGKNVAADTDEIKGQREKVNDLQGQLNAAKGQLDALTAANNKTVDPVDLHAQHYAVKTLEDELKGTNPAGIKPSV